MTTAAPGSSPADANRSVEWLYESLVNNKPFDQFTRELLSPPGEGSRGFIDGIRWRGEVSAGQTVEIRFARASGSRSWDRPEVRLVSRQFH